MRATRILLAALSAVAVVTAPVQTFAQTVPSVSQAEKKPAASGVKSYEAGAKSFEAGKYGPAIQSLSTALSMGGLSSQQMAKALYYRGAAYRKTGKSAQAISDLTSAVWLKNGLSDADRAAATEQRQSAYQDAGLGTASPVGTPPLDAAPTTAATPASVQPAAAVVSSPASPPAAATPADSATSSWAATSEKNAAEASIPNLSTPAGGYATLSSPDAPSLGALPQGETGTPATAAPGGGVGTAISNAGSAVTGFFGGMFGGGGSATESPPAEVATAAVSPASPPAATGWDSGTSVVSAPPKPEKPVTKKKTAAADPARVTAAGKYRLQVGIVRSREEAEQITSRLRAEHAQAFGTAAAAIDEVTFGNGTFYRVQVGPYASAAEPGQFCTALKPKGYDCLVVTK